MAAALMAAATQAQAVGRKPNGNRQLMTLQACGRSTALTPVLALWASLPTSIGQRRDSSRRAGITNDTCRALLPAMCMATKVGSPSPFGSILVWERVGRLNYPPQKGRRRMATVT